MRKCKRWLSSASNDIHLFDDSFRRQGFKIIAGVDEAGRGPLAGPVVAAAVILPSSFKGEDVMDSKKIQPHVRRRLFQEILNKALAVQIGYATAQEIDNSDILRSTLRAMEGAVTNLRIAPTLLLIDGPYKLKLDIPQRGIPGGDNLSLAIGAASIVAKVFRDHLMDYYHHLYPQYGFDKHKGYPTPSHLERLSRFGPSPIHRRSFRRVGKKLFC